MTDDLFAGRYRLESRLGVGGMSTVQLAFDTRLERNVAVKLLAEHLAQDDGFVARFRREALAAARLVHPNVVQVYDFGTDEASGRQFIAMEYVEGQSGAELLREHGRLTPQEVVDICAQACRGLDYAHRNGVVHRDIKPGNILRNPEGIVKIADFGIAKAADDSDITRVGSVIGTAAYLAPEQARGEPAGPPSDLYALGVVAYQLATGRLPYQGASLTDLARQQEAGPPTDITAVVPDVDPALGLAIMLALVADPNQRYQSAPEMEKALRDGLRGIAPEGLESEDATVALGSSTAATRAMIDDPPTRTHQPLEPLMEDEPVPPRRQIAREAPRKKKRSPIWTVLLFVVIVAVLVAGAYFVINALNGPTTTDFVNDFDQTIRDLRNAITENTK